jgi:hypothetical protein
MFISHRNRHGHGGSSAGGGKGARPSEAPPLGRHDDRGAGGRERRRAGMPATAGQGAARKQGSRGAAGAPGGGAAGLRAGEPLWRKKMKN